MLEPSTLRGIIPPICTPLTDSGDVDVESVHSMIDFLLSAGVHGIFALGSTGESTSLTGRQRRTLIDAVVAAVGGRVPVLAGIMDTSTNRCVEHGLAAKEAGVDALVLAANYYYRTSQAEIVELFRQVRAAVDLPLMAYDVPTVNVKLETATLKQLATEGTIIGFKDSSGATELFRRTLIELRDTPFRAFTGSELIIDAYFQMGAHGSVPGLANVLPREYVTIYDLSLAGEWAAAARIQERLLLCFYELITQGEPRYSASSSALGGFKTGLKLMGAIRSTRVAEPLHSFGPADEERVADVLRRHGYLS